MTNFIDLMRILWQHKLTTILTTITSIIIVIIGIVLLPPTYSADALVRVSVSPSSINARVDLAYVDRIMNTYTVMITSRPVLDQVIADLDLEMTRNDLKQSIHAQAIEDTELIKVSVVSSQPENAAQIANATVDALISELASAPRTTSTTILTQINEIQEELADARIEYDRLLINEPDQTQRISELSRSTTIKQQTYEELLDQYDQARLSESLMFSSITLVDPAILPESSTRVSRVLILGLALLVGILGGIGLSLFFHNASNTVMSLTQLQPLLALPVIGVIPTMVKPHNIEHRDHLRLEAFRYLRTDFLALYGSSKVIAITSANPSEGKSTIVANLALSLAGLKRKVLIIDCDLRSPTQNKLFNLSNEVGISSVLMNPQHVYSSIQDTNTSFLKVMTSGPVSSQSTELLSLTPERFKKLLNLLQQEYDYILLDTTPLLPIADATIVIPLADVVFQVIRMGYSVETAIVLAQQKIAQLHIGQAGILLNDVAQMPVQYPYNVIPSKVES